MAGNFPSPIPTSWFAVAASGSLQPGDVFPIRYFDSDLVLFRTESGRAQVFDAHCPHLGAHFGHGGRVAGENLVCPFHGWAFDGSGTCVQIEYASRIPARARVACWPTLERNGFVWVWHDPASREAWFDVPNLTECESDEWVEVSRHKWVIRTQIQEMAENGVDSAHFPTVHGAAALPESRVYVKDHLRVAKHKVPLDTSKGAASSFVEVHGVGMGLSFTRFTGIAETTSLNLVTPIDGDTLEFTVLFLQPKAAPRSGVTAAIIADLIKQVNEDVPIWENKVYRGQPVLCDGDGPIAEFRRWCQQFYAGEPS